MRLKPTGKLVILILVVGLAFGAYRMWNKIAPEAAVKSSVEVKKIDLVTNDGGGGGGGEGSTSVPYTAAGDEPGCTDKPEVRLLGYAWNAQMGMHLANGGPRATKGSLMCKHGVNFKFERQDDNGKLQEALVAFATELSQGHANPSKGTHFITMMGDGSAAFLSGLNSTLRKIGPEYQAKIVDAIGYSRGEDKFMGPAAWKVNPQASMGGVVAGVLRDGDWNIAEKWLGDNGLRTNPDEKTYDPDALNWVNASDYIDACQKYIAGYSETRPVVHNGKRTGQTKTITVNGVVTWTPGDVIVAEKKGGLVSIISTKEYSSQMPCVVIGIDKWMKNNRSTVENMIQAIGEGSDMVKSSTTALHHASEISAAVYHEADAGPDFWETYFKGTQKVDKTGALVDLGGSSVNNLSESLLAFGLLPGSADAVSATYTVFGDLVVSQYKELVPSIDPASQVIDKSYLQSLMKHSGPTHQAIVKARPIFKPSTSSHVTLSRKAWHLQFNAGQATFTPQAKAQLEKLSRDLLIASGTVVEIHGHTDNQGNPATSMPLSEARAFSVKNWLQKRAPVNFPAGRIRVFAHGETNPVAPNSTPEGRAQNRRVEIVLKAAD
jgi:OOP family OmpA-OmpF porin